MKAGDKVRVLIGSRFTPNRAGAPITLPGRDGGEVLGLDQYGNWEVLWPNGETYSYERALLSPSA